MRITSLVFVSLIACGGGKQSERTVMAPAHEQPLADAVTALCAAPTRAEADPDWAKAEDPGRKAQILGKHLTTGVEHPRALKVGNEGDAEGLAAIVKESGVASCRLQEVWKVPEADPAPVAPQG